MFEQKRGGWVGRENAFFEFFLREVLTTPPPARPIYPRGGDPSPQRTRTDCTAQAAAQTVPDASQTAHSKPRTDTHAQTLDTLHRSALDTRQIAPAAGAGGRGVCPAKCTISGAIFILIYICIFCVKPLTTQI